jgi:NhaP-type Na+/H+ or K+/H+ antiporter
MTELEIFRSTLFCAIGGIALGAVLGFLNGWARARFAGERKPPAWLEPARIDA